MNRANKYGQTAPECADALFMYGKALLANAIQKNSLNGEATNKKLEEKQVAETQGTVFILSSFLY